MDRSWKDYGTILAMSVDPGQKSPFVCEHHMNRQDDFIVVL